MVNEKDAFSSFMIKNKGRHWKRAWPFVSFVYGKAKANQENILCSQLLRPVENNTKFQLETF